jgi:hypothetical protein
VILMVILFVSVSVHRSWATGRWGQMEVESGTRNGRRPEVWEEGMGWEVLMYRMLRWTSMVNGQVYKEAGKD